MVMVRRALIGITISVIALILGIYVLGSLAPEKHTAQGSIEVPIDIVSLFARVSDFESSASWRSDVETVRRLEDREGHPVYEEETSHGILRYQVVELLPGFGSTPARVVTEIVDNEDFGGTWTYEVAPTEDGSRLTIREDGFVPNPVFRFFSRYVFGYQASIDAYLASVEELGRPQSATSSTSKPSPVRVRLDESELASSPIHLQVDVEIET